MTTDQEKLEKLKKQLKQELLTERKPKSKRRRPTLLLLVLLICVLAFAAYPLYQDYQASVPQLMLDEAIKYEGDGLFDKAQSLYQELVKNHQQTQQSVDALLRLARLQQYDYHDERHALIYYLQLEKNYPDSLQAYEARAEAAHIVKYSLRDYSRAIVFYQQLLNDEQGPLDQYLYEIADCYFRLEKYTQARIELETLIEEHPESDQLDAALYRSGHLLVLEKKDELAAKNWQRLIDEHPRSTYRAQAELSLARMLEEQNQLTKALERYRQLDRSQQPALLEEKIKSLQKRIEVKNKAI